ncbi:MAG: site-specific integrase [Actinomycetota bacterium]|nr:site-specific integrase [Actinomycetota bacterium]
MERDWTAATEATYRSALDKHLLPAFGEQRVESVSTAKIERWRNERVSKGGMQRRQANMLLAILHGIFKRAQRHHDLQRNPTVDVPKLRESYDAARFDFYSPEEIRRLAKHAEHEQDGIAYLVAAFTGIRRGELVGLLWEDVDFDNHSIRVWEQISRAGERGRPKSRKSRTVPMIEQAAEPLGRLKDRGYPTRPKDPVFLGEDGATMDGSALRRRYLKDREAAGLRELRFHDLRHTFGSLAINFASIVQVQAWMGHAKITTTMRYLHHKSREDDARLLSAAFASREGRAAETVRRRRDPVLMFERTNRTERFFAIDDHDDNRALVAGMDWLFDFAVEHEHSEATIWFAAVQSITFLERAYDWNVVGALRDRRMLRHQGVSAHVVTPRTRDVIRGPVLAYWPSDDALDELDGRQPTALCAVASAPERIASWLGSWSPGDLLAPGATPPAVTVSNPVVAVALADLTDSVNHNNGLSSPYERSLTILTFRALLAGGEAYDPAEIRAEAVRLGWEPRFARDLAQLAADMGAGKRPRIPRGGFSDLHPDALARWRAEAAGTSSAR